jgi:hypothetical protein
MQLAGVTVNSSISLSLGVLRCPANRAMTLPLALSAAFLNKPD